MSARITYLLGLLAVVTILAISFYIQVIEGFVPCPLCTLQRLSFACLGFSLFVGIFIHRYFIARIIINTFALLFSCMGMFFAGRQVWLQKFPSAVGNECGVDIHYMLQVLPLHEVIQKIFEGSAECTQRGWELWHLNMAEWSFVCFILFTLYSVHLHLRELRWYENGI